MTMPDNEDTTITAAPPPAPATTEASLARAMAAVTEAAARLERAIPEDRRGLLELAPAANNPTARLEWLTKAHEKGLFIPPATSSQPASVAAPPAEMTGYENWKFRQDWLNSLAARDPAHEEAARLDYSQRLDALRSSPAGATAPPPPERAPVKTLRQWALEQMELHGGGGMGGQVPKRKGRGY